MSRASRRRFAVAFLVTLAALGIAACRPEPVAGASCREIGQGTCLDGARALRCDLFAWKEVACRGPAGCTAEAAGLRCDETRALTGDPCADNAPPVCSVDGSSLLRCDERQRLPARACRGPHACAPARDASSSPVCDRGPVLVGDPCDAVGSGACSASRGEMLTCTSRNVFEINYLCRGPKRCYGSTEHKDMILCDDSLADVGERCSGAPGGKDLQSGKTWCSRDGKWLNTCRAGAVVHEAACLDPCIPTFKGADSAPHLGCDRNRTVTTTK